MSSAADPTLFLNPMLDAAAIRAALEPCGIDVAIEIHPTIGSTNDRGREYLTQPAPQPNPPNSALSHPAPLPPVIVAADFQGAGRGRHGRIWFSPPGVNVLFSLAIPAAFYQSRRGNETVVPRDALQLVAAVAICHYIERRTGLRPGIKWPNDVEIEGEKLAGILCEVAGGLGDPARRVETPEARGIVIGMGINVNLGSADLPPELVGTRAITSLRVATGRLWPREEIIGSVSRDLLRLLSPNSSASLREAMWREAIEAWRARCTTLGRWISVQRGRERLEGTAAALEDDGALLMRDTTGRLHSLRAGEVTVEAIG